MKPLLIITTFLGGVGPTGVETHFREIMREAGSWDCETVLVTPYSGSRWRRGLYRPLKAARSEIGSWLYKRGQATALRRQLDELLHVYYQRRPITIYTQCPSSAEVALQAAGGRDVRVLLAVHYNESEAEEMRAKGLASENGWWWRQLMGTERRVLPRLDGIVFVSDYMRRVVNARVPRVTGVPQATLFNFPPPRSDAEPVGPARDLIAIGTIEPRKNQLFLLQVLTELRKLGRHYSLTIVGDGPDRRMLEIAASAMGLEKYVHFAGFVPAASTLIPAHRALVHAALLENCPMIVAEALSHGRPIFAAAVGGIPELYTDGVEGRFWDLGDAPAAARLVVDLLEDPTRYAQASAAARARYDRAFAGLRDRWMNFLLAAEAEYKPARTLAPALRRSFSS